MTVTEARVLCDERAGQCRCFQSAGHVEAGDPVHACDARRCTGMWIGTFGEAGFRIVSLPWPVAEPVPWDTP